MCTFMRLPYHVVVSDAGRFFSVLKICSVTIKTTLGQIHVVTTCSSSKLAESESNIAAALQLK